MQNMIGKAKQLLHEGYSEREIIDALIGIYGVAESYARSALRGAKAQLRGFKPIGEIGGNTEK